MKIFVTGATGFLGRHVVEEILHQGYFPIYYGNGHRADLRYEDGAGDLVGALEGCSSVIHLAANCGGIGYNQKNQIDMLDDNLRMALNVTWAAQKAGCQLINIGTVCSYPKNTPVPFKEENLWNGYPEETNAPYGIAKRVLFELSRLYSPNSVNLLVANMYGPGDCFDDRSHVIPAIIRNLVHRKQDGARAILWGTGTPTRDFLFVEDAAQAIVKVATSCHRSDGPVNIGTGMETSIQDLAYMIADIIGYDKDKILWDDTNPDGQPRRCLDTSKAKKLFGWEATTPLREGLKKTIEWYYSRGH